jgi:pantoate--beta-alanine ligase
MHLERSIPALRDRRRALLRTGRTVALVPTMGALHAGHLALVRRARELADEAWVSLFVNPAQFGPGEDLDSYPRDLEGDRGLLQSEGVALLFAPSSNEVYPQPPAVRISLPDLAAGLCGAYRPGHFDGVALVVTKLLNIVQPEVAVFGAKDFQQAAIVTRLVADLDMPARIEVVPTVREVDGLAMSSRNRNLDPDQRRRAASISRTLKAARTAIVEGGERSARRLESLMGESLAAEAGVRLQYVAVVDADSLQPLDAVGGRTLLAIAAHVGSTRLIDNLVVEVP